MSATLPEALRAYQKKNKNASWRTIGQQVGVDGATLSRIVRGATRPQRATIQRIADALGFSSSDVDRWQQQYTQDELDEIDRIRQQTKP